MMKLLIYSMIFGLLAVEQETTAEDTKQETTKESNHHPYVVNGQNADPHEWPWQILLKRNGDHICGGSLMNSQWVLTAAHCVEPQPDPSIYTVEVGVHDRQHPTAVQKSYKLKGLRYHENYNPSSLQYDVALLQLDGTVQISDKVKPIELPPENSRIAEGKVCFITGWGNLNGTSRESPNILQEASLRIGNYSHCKALNGELVHDPTMLCTGAEGKGGCNGDSGGPLSCNEGGKWILRGVVSWGRRECPVSFYTIFSRVSSFISWINKTQKGVFDCSFEQNLCLSWEQDTTDNFDWLRIKGPTPSSNTGPSRDHTFGSGNGYYMYIETSSPRVRDEKARLISKPRPATNQTCLSFWYHMYGSDINTLRVLVKKGQLSTALFSKTGNQGDRWYLGQVAITSTVDYQVIFEGTVGGGFFGDIAIDDIKFSDGPCKSASQNCDFEENVCFWRQQTTDHHDWIRHRYKTPSSSTGPTADHTTGLAIGYYMYFETSSIIQDNKARLISGPHAPTEHTCFSFWYHMYGSDVGTLKVLVKDDANETVVLSLSGNSGNQWLKANVTIRSNKNYEVILEAVRDRGFYGDIAVDDIDFTNGSCNVPISYNCTFEESHCFIWDQDNSDTIDWTRHRGSTRTGDTGPSVDHTTNTSLGYYMYIETSTPRKYDDRARLISKRLSPTNNTELWFWHHMYGTGVHILRVLMKTTLQETIVWSKQGNQGNIWNGKKLNFKSQIPFQIIIEGVCGFNYTGDIAIDDIAIYNAIEYIPDFNHFVPTTAATTPPASTVTTTSRSSITAPPSTTKAKSLRCYHCIGEICASGERLCESGDHVCAKISFITTVNRTCIDNAMCSTYCEGKSRCDINCCSDSDLCNDSVTLRPPTMVIFWTMSILIARTFFK